MVYLLSTLRGKDRDRASAFVTIGLIAVAVEENIKQYLPKIMEFIRVSLPAKVTSNFIIIFYIFNSFFYYLNYLYDIYVDRMDQQKSGQVD